MKNAANGINTRLITTDNIRIYRDVFVDLLAIATQFPYPSFSSTLSYCSLDFIYFFHAVSTIIYSKQKKYLQIIIKINKDTMNIKPLYMGFRSTTIWKAFILNSVANSIIIFLAIYLKQKFDNVYDTDGLDVTTETTWKSAAITMFVTFLSTLLTYSMLWFTLGYGMGQIS